MILKYHLIFDAERMEWVLYSFEKGFWLFETRGSIGAILSVLRARMIIEEEVQMDELMENQAREIL